MVKQRHEPGPPMTLGNKTNAEEYRELAEQEAALAKAAITNESRPTITRWLPIHALGGGEGKVGEDDGSHDRRCQRLRIVDKMNPKHPPGPPMTLGNMREQGVPHLIAFCLHDCLGCRRRGLVAWLVRRTAAESISHQLEGLSSLSNDPVQMV